MWDIKPGDEVVCVDASWGWFSETSPLVEGARYRVEGVFARRQDRPREFMGRGVPAPIVLRLAGASHPTHSRPDSGFNAARFRPVRKSRKGDGSAIEQLREIARRESIPTPIKTREKA